jgi:RNA polymerase sigma factor (TIGR02999 family)
MEKQVSHDITELLLAWRNGDAEAFNTLASLVYDELRLIAHRYMSNERNGHTLQTTALVNEAFLRLVNFRQIEWQDRTHFFSVAATLMRRVLVDFARARNYQKRGGGAQQESLSEADVLLRQEWHNLEDILAVHEAVEQLAQADERCAKVVEMRFFGGLTNEEIAEVLGVTDRTVKNDWRYAKMWLRRALRDSPQNE